jgi:hypothetical protein
MSSVGVAMRDARMPVPAPARVIWVRVGSEVGVSSCARMLVGEGGSGISGMNWEGWVAP